MPASPGLSPSRDTDSRGEAPECLGISTCFGGDTRGRPRVSSALVVNLAEDRSSRASLCPRMYCSSGAGKAGDRGTAIALAARTASHVTTEHDQHTFEQVNETMMNCRDSRLLFKLTYIVVAVLHEEGNALAVDVIPACGLEEPVAHPAHVAKQLAVPEGPLGGRVDDHGRLRVMTRDGLEHGQSRQCRCHPRERKAESINRGALGAVLGKPVAQAKWSCEW